MGTSVTYSGELRDFYSSRNIIWMIKSKGMSWVRHVAGMDEKKDVCIFWWGNLEERVHMRDLDIN